MLLTGSVPLSDGHYASVVVLHARPSLHLQGAAGKADGSELAPIGPSWRQIECKCVDNGAVWSHRPTQFAARNQVFVGIAATVADTGKKRRMLHVCWAPVKAPWHSKALRPLSKESLRCYGKGAQTSDHRSGGVHTVPYIKALVCCQPAICLMRLEGLDAGCLTQQRSHRGANL